ncbi:MAG: GntR family transcriptional regulator [Deltaproteobacteria bacterium]|nr:GntR family transcriptional regulator [Deltaproteobacteria bacterium]
MALGPISPRESSHQACEHALRRAVIDGSLGPGQRLPAERALAATLGVSRLTLRAALAALTARGLLAVKHGSGYIVQDFTQRGGADLLPDLPCESASVARELLRVRRHLAHAILERLVEHPPGGLALRGYTRAVDNLEALVTQARPVAEIAAGDLEVIRSLVAGTASAVLALCLNPVVNVIASSAGLRDALYGEPRTNVAGWRALGEWLKKPRREALRALLDLLEAHDRESLKRLQKRRSR